MTPTVKIMTLASFVKLVSFCVWRSSILTIPSVTRVNLLDTTGAVDEFNTTRRAACSAAVMFVSPKSNRVVLDGVHQTLAYVHDKRLISELQQANQCQISAAEKCAYAVFGEVLHVHVPVAIVSLKGDDTCSSTNTISTGLVHTYVCYLYTNISTAATTI